MQRSFLLPTLPLFLVLASRPDSQVAEVNGPLARGYDKLVINGGFSDDGRVFAWLEFEGPAGFGLFANRLQEDGEAHRLTTLPGDFHFNTQRQPSWSLTPTGEHVIYRSRFEGHEALWSIRTVAGATPVLVSGDLEVDSSVLFTADPSGTLIAFGARAPGETGPSLFLAAVAAPRALERRGDRGGRLASAERALRRLAGPFGDTDQILSAEFSPDASRVLYQVFSPPADDVALHSILTDGSDDVELRPPGSRFAGGPLFTPDGARVVLRSNPDVDSRGRPSGPASLYVMSPDGVGVPLLLTSDSVRVTRLPSDGRTAVYTDAGGLWSAPLDGSTVPIQLGATTFTLELSPDGAWAVTSDSRRIYSVPVDGSRPQQQIASSSRSVNFLQVAEAKDGGPAHVVYRTSVTPGPGITSRNEAFEVPVDGSSPARVVSDPSFDVLELAAAPGVVFYLFRQLNTFGPVQVQLHAASLDEVAPPIPFALPLVPTGTVFRLDLSPDEETLVYGGTLRSLSAAEYFARPVDGSTGPRLVSGPSKVQITGSVVRFFPPRNGRVVYLASEGESDDRPVVPYPIYQARDDGSGESTVVRRRTHLHPETVTAMEWTPEGRELVYVSNDEREGLTRVSNFLRLTLELFVVDADGGDARRLHPLASAGSQVDAIATTPDGRRVVYLADHDLPLVSELYTTPVDGSAPPQKIHGDLTSGREFHQFEVTSGGTVLYLVDDGLDGLPKLFAAPADGSVAPRELNQPVPAGSRSGILEFRVLPGGTHVLFLGCQEFPDVLELFVVPVDGSAAPLRLNHTLPTTGNARVSEIVPTPDGSQVAYVVRGGPNSGAVHVAATDGSSVRQGVGTDVRFGSLQVTPDGSRLVYLSSLTGYLQMVPLDGSTTQAQVGDTFVRSEVVLSADGSHVAWEGSDPATSLAVLMGARLVPGSTSQVLSQPVPLNPDPYGEPGDIERIEFADASRQIVFSIRSGNSTDVFAVPVDGSAPERSLVGSLRDGGGTGAAFELTPDRSRALVLERGPGARLWSVPLSDGIRESVRAAVR